MRVAFIADSLKAGGAQKMMCFVINSIASSFEKINVILMDNTDIAYPLPSNAEVVRLECEEKIPRYPRSNFQKLKALIDRARESKRIIKREKIDIVCGFGVYFATVAVLASKKTNAKTIVSERRSPANLDIIWRFISKMTYSASDRIIFQLEGASSFYRNICDEKKVIIPNPYLSSSVFLPISISERRHCIAMAAARLEDVKGFDIGIKAFKKVKSSFPDFSLEIYGAGSFEEMYSKLIMELGLEKSIVYKGLSTHIIEDIRDVYVFLLPSRYEGIPNMLLEAMGAGIPCVATNCPPGGPRMLIGNNQYGILVDVDDVDGIAEAIGSLIICPRKAEELGNKAQIVREKFSKQVISEMWRNAFTSL